jgi:hypothetical protein
MLRVREAGMSEVVKEYGTGKLVSSHDFGMKALGLVPPPLPEGVELKELDPEKPPIAVFLRVTRRLGLRPLVVVLPRFLNRFLRRRHLLHLLR